MEQYENENVSDTAFSPIVKTYQERYGSRESYARMEQRGGFRDKVTEDLYDFIMARDSFYFGTASKDGQPYIQHRGGEKGFLKILDPYTLAFADYKGNKQYITAGTLAENNKAYIFLMDYPHRRRVKIWGTAKVADDETTLSQFYDANPDKVERVIFFRVKMIDINCPQYIKPRYSVDEMPILVQKLQQEIYELKKENERLKKKL